MPHSSSKGCNKLTNSIGLRVERRSITRRLRQERRLGEERRHDYRLSPGSLAHPFLRWVLSIIYPRIGLDRRTGRDRRRQSDRRQLKLHSILTKEEQRDLLA